MALRTGKTKCCPNDLTSASLNSIFFMKLAFYYTGTAFFTKIYVTNLNAGTFC